MTATQSLVNNDSNRDMNSNDSNTDMDNIGSKSDMDNREITNCIKIQKLELIS